MMELFDFAPHEGPFLSFAVYQIRDVCLCVYSSQRVSARAPLRGAGHCAALVGALPDLLCRDFQVSCLMPVQASLSSATALRLCFGLLSLISQMHFRCGDYNYCCSSVTQRGNCQKKNR